MTTSCCLYIFDCIGDVNNGEQSFRVRIFQALFQKMTHQSDSVLMKADEKCLELFLIGTKQKSEYDIPRDDIQKEPRPTLMKMSDFDTFTYVVVKRLVVFSRLFQSKIV